MNNNLDRDIILPSSLTADFAIKADFNPGLSTFTPNVQSIMKPGSAGSTQGNISMTDWINHRIAEGDIDVTGSAGAAVTIDGTQTITGDKTFSGTSTFSGTTALSGVVNITGATFSTVNATSATIDSVTVSIGDVSAINNESVIILDDSTSSVDFNNIVEIDVASLGDYADDTAAGVGGVAVGGLYVITGTGAVHRRLS